jgi:hypothetical protein
LLELKAGEVSGSEVIREEGLSFARAKSRRSVRQRSFGKIYIYKKVSRLPNKLNVTLKVILKERTKERI